MAKQNRNIIFTTIAIEAETDKLIEKLCKRYSLKKGHSCISPWQYNHVIQRLWTL